MENIKDFFREVQETFTIYVVEQRFVVGRGNDYFKSFKGKENLITTNTSIEKNITKILKWILKKTPDVAELTKSYLSGGISSTALGIVEVVTTLSKLFAINEHQAAGPEVIDPIIIQEEGIDSKYLSQLVALHKESILQPVIIILLKDNNFERAKELLSKCPHGINVKMIRNSGESEIFKVINKGAEDIMSFLDAFSRQCFSTCSRTQRGVLLNKDWSENSTVKYFSPLVFKIRTNLLFDEKDEVRNDISKLIENLNSTNTMNSNERTLILSLTCMTKLFRVYCNDYGGQDIIDALELAKEIDNEILLAHVYRYAFFLKQYSEQDKKEMLLKAQMTFQKHNIEDHAIYCQNNNIIQQFYTNNINIREFRNMQQEALYNIPGLVGMSYIYNNTGVAHIYAGRPDEAIEFFAKGLDYARDRIVQKLSLQCNMLIAKEYTLQTIDEKEIRILVNYIFDNLGTTRLPFIAANLIINSIAIALKRHPGLATSLINRYPIQELIKNALTPGQMGSGSLVQQIAVLTQRYPELKLDNIPIPTLLSKVTGIRLNFLINNGYNPTIFHAWL